MVSIRVALLRHTDADKEQVDVVSRQWVGVKRRRLHTVSPFAFTGSNLEA
jgi:hypothetical protein